jgi:hypothetical protein
MAPEMKLLICRLISRSLRASMVTVSGVARVSLGGLRVAVSWGDNSAD